MPQYDCPRESCVYQTTNLPDAVAAVVLQDHLKTVHPAASMAGGLKKARPPSMPLPKVTTDIFDDQWSSFLNEWESFKNTTELPHDSVNRYLLSCCEEELRNSVLRAEPRIIDKDEREVLNAIKKLAVMSVAVCTLQSEVIQMQQDHTEPVRHFAARVKGKAMNGKFRKAVTCGRTGCAEATVVDFTDEIVKMVVLTGLGDDDVKKEVLATDKLESMSLEQTIATVELREQALRSLSSTMPPVKAASAEQPTKYAKSDPRLKKEGKCKECSRTFRCFILTRAEKVIEITTCKDCFKKTQHARRDSNKQGKRDGTKVGSSEENAMMWDMMGLDHVPEHDCGVEPPVIATVDTHTEWTVRVPNMVFDGTKGWQKHLPESHPMLTLSVRTDASDYGHINRPDPKLRPTKVSAVCDSGAQSCLISKSMIYSWGLKPKDITPVLQNMNTISGEGIKILGAVFLRVSGIDRSGQCVEAPIMAYVTESTKRFYLSQQAMRQLGVIGSDFPTVSAPRKPEISGATASCGCPKHCKPPPRPETLPFAATPENVGKMKEWILNRYASSTFNKCPHQHLPLMKCEPLKLHLDANAKPSAVYTAATVPLHWRAEIKAQLDQDVALGVIEKVPPGEPTVWQARMHVVPKHDGTPRRTVDMRSLNKNCKRESQHVVPPFKQARSIPHGQWKTVTDAWNGYHSVPLAKEDRHLTTFITEWGRYRYLAAPQGYVASGDAYNARYDQIIEDVEKKTKCVDDVAIWDEDLEEHWWRALDYLTLIGVNGIICSPTKFQFCQREVSFAGFIVGENTVKPLPKYIDSIQSFKRPTCIGDVRAWFGLVNQVSRYGRLSEIMHPFKELLSPKSKFKWTEELEVAFEQSKLSIVAAIEEGVEIFDPDKTTLLSPDFSKKGIGYYMYQKHCSCPSSTTTECCETGWKIVLAGSRFLRKSELNYWPVEGEALAVKWALEDTRFFTWGCRDLHVQTDHRPLVKLLGGKPLNDIDNSRLVSFVEKTMPWRFSISYVPGRSIPGPDAASRRPVDSAIHHEDEDEPDPYTGVRMGAEAMEILMIDCEPDQLEDGIIAAARAALCPVEAVTWEAVTWERVQEETAKDATMLELLQLASTGFPEVAGDMPLLLLPYWRYRESLMVVDSVLMYGARVVVPPSLRKEVCRHIHGAHQGVSRMTGRAQESVFWPGITGDIVQARNECRSCDQYAPSQPAMPAATPMVAQYPFQAVASDFCEYGGNHFLITVDRFSNWPTISSAKPGTPSSGTRGLLGALRILFATFGIPEEISSDGGPEYTSNMFGGFLKKWGVCHRISSAHHAQSNGRAEVCVKSVKRLLRANVSADGSLDTDAVMRGLLQLRNTPEPDTNLSPAQVLLGRKLRDFLPMPPGMTAFDEASPVRNEWKTMWRQKEVALKRRMGAMVDKIDAKAHNLEPLSVGDYVHIQNQHGNHPTRWDRTGVVMQVGEHDKYLIRAHGSRRVTARNRRFLRKFLPLGEKMLERYPVTPANDEVPLRQDSTPVPPAPALYSPGPQETPAPTNLHKQPEPVPVTIPEPTQDSFPVSPMAEPVVEEPPPLRRSTRVRKMPDFYGRCVENGK